MFWRHVLETWDEQVIPDLAEIYRIDALTIDDRPWWWLRSLIAGLTGTSSRLQRWAVSKEAS